MRVQAQPSDERGVLGWLRRALRPAPGESVAGAAAEVGLGELTTVLLGIARRLTETLDRPEVLQTIVDETNHALAADGTAIHLLRHDRLDLAATCGLDETFSRALADARGHGWFAEVLATGRPLVLDPDDAFGAFVVVPLIRRGAILGTLASVGRRPRRWTPVDVEFVTALASHAANAIHNAELFARTESRAAQLAVVQAASARLSRAEGIEAVGRALVEETRRVIDYHNARVYVIEPPDRVVPIAFEGRVGAYEHVDMDLLRCRLGEGFTGWVAEHGTPMLVDDANADARGATIAGTDEIDESMLVVPMRYDEIVVGVITLSKLGLRQFDEDDLRLLSILADNAATALESARLLARSDGLARELRRLLDMSSALSQSLDPRQVANLIAAHLAAAMGVDECAISYWDRANQRVQTLGYAPALKVEQLEPFYDVTGFPETLRVLRDQVTVVVHADDPTADPAEVALLRKDGNAALAMLPLVAKGESIGLVELMSTAPITFDESRLALARTMANEAAMALENARLYEDARNLADRDPLTGFYNHRYVHQRLGAEVVRARRSRLPLSVLMIDLDDFKLVNDTFGHLFGDRVLAWVADRIRETLRASDVPARYGGDEFAVILPETDAGAAAQAAARILEAVTGRPYDAGEHGAVPVAASIGAATYPVDARTPTELLAGADRALYRVKTDGGHGVETASTRTEVPPDTGPTYPERRLDSVDAPIHALHQR